MTFHRPFLIVGKFFSCSVEPSFKYFCSSSDVSVLSVLSLDVFDDVESPVTIDLSHSDVRPSLSESGSALSLAAATAPVLSPVAPVETDSANNKVFNDSEEPGTT